MEKIVYNYSSSKAKKASIAMFIIGMALALFASFTVGTVRPIGPGMLLNILLIVGCILLCVSTKKISCTLAAVIVTGIALFVKCINDYSLLDVFANFSSGGSYDGDSFNRVSYEGLANTIGVIIALIATVGWVLLAVGNGKLSKGIRNKKLTTVGALMVAIMPVVSLVAQIIIFITGGMGLHIVMCSFMDSISALLIGVGCFALTRSEIEETVVVIPEPQPVVVNSGATNSSDENGTPQGASIAGFEPQNILVNIILTVITFGIYSWVWFYRNAKRVRQLNGESTKGCGDELLLYIFGGVLYGMYWYYTRSKQLNAAAKQLGYDGIFLSPMLYLLLAVFTPSVFQLAFLTANFNKLYQRACGAEENQGKASDEAKVYLAQRHGLLKVVLLGLVTFGIYFIITLVRISNRIKLMQGKQAANTVQLICMFIIPFYWIIWLLMKNGKYHEGSNEATLEAWMLMMIPFYSIYWLITRTAELRVGAEQFGVTIAEEGVWTMLFAMITPVISYANMLININRVADTMSIAG